MQKINEELLIKNGYKEYDVPPYEKYSTKLFQKVFKEDGDKKYYIDFKKWEFPVHGKIEVHWEGEVQLYAKGSHNAVDLTFHNGWGLDAVERYAKQIYELGFEPYEGVI